MSNIYFNGIVDVPQSSVAGTCEQEGFHNWCSRGFEEVDIKMLADLDVFGLRSSRDYVNVEPILHQFVT